MAVQQSEAGQGAVVHAPAYVSVGTFYNFLDYLKEGLPGKVDKSLMANLSGGTQSHLLSALKFLGLIEDNGDVTSSMKALVDARGTDSWGAEFKTVLKLAYGPIFGDFEIQKATPKQLRDKFRDARAGGSTTEKAVRFYLKALDECGETYPAVLGKSPRPVSKKRENSSRPNSGNSGDDTNANRGQKRNSGAGEEEGMIDFPIPMGEKPGFIRVRADLTKEQLPMVDAMMNAVRVLAETNSASS